MRVNGLNIQSLADLRVALTARTIVVTTLRGEVQDDRVIYLAGWSSSTPTDLVFAWIAIAILALCLFAYLAPLPASLEWVRRRIRAPNA